MGLGLVYVFVSSWFGLNGPLIVGLDPLPEMVAFFWEIWTSSFWASAVFLLGTLAAGAVGYRVACRAHPVASVGSAFLANWAVYLSSYLLLDEGPAEAARESLAFVLRWGWAGLLLAAVLPVLATRARDRWPHLLGPPRFAG